MSKLCEVMTSDRSVLNTRHSNSFKVVRTLDTAGKHNLAPTFGHVSIDKLSLIELPRWASTKFKMRRKGCGLSFAAAAFGSNHRKRVKGTALFAELEMRLLLKLTFGPTEASQGDETELSFCFDLMHVDAQSPTCRQKHTKKPESVESELLVRCLP